MRTSSSAQESAWSRLSITQGPDITASGWFLPIKKSFTGMSFIALMMGFYTSFIQLKSNEVI
jgi:hypothetical protein